MADRRPAARMQLVEVEDAPTAADRSRPADNPPPQDDVTSRSQPPAGRRARPAPVVARRCGRRARRRRVRRRGVRRGTARSSLASPRCPAWSDPSTRRPSRCGRPARPRCPAPCSRPTARSSCSREGERAWTVTSHDAVSGAQRWAVDLAPVSRAGFEATAAVCPPCAATSATSSCASSGTRGCCTPTTRRSRSRRGSRSCRCRRRTASASATGRSAGTLVAFDRVEDDLVIGTLDAEGRMIVQRRDARTGDVVWSIVTPVGDERPRHQRRGGDARAASAGRARGRARRSSSTSTTAARS